jgi:dihydroorotate dehydrogenase electron transfer subunit
MSAPAPGAASLVGRVVANAAVSSGLLRLDLELAWPLEFAPGQFAMLNLTGDRQLVFGRPFSILAADGPVVSFLYRVVGRGTALLAGLRNGDRLNLLGPLGRPFPPPDEQRVLILAGGVGLPPLHAWWERHRRPQDRAFFGSRDPDDVPWSLLEHGWQVSVDVTGPGTPERRVFVGLVTDAAGQALAEERERAVRDASTATDPTAAWCVLACGPLPLLRAAAAWSRQQGWPCFVSVEEHMGCGYGVCKGCVVPLRDPAEDLSVPPDRRPFRPATSCEVGPVFAAETIDWDVFGRPLGPEGGVA